MFLKNCTNWNMLHWSVIFIAQRSLSLPIGRQACRRGAGLQFENYFKAAPYHQKKIPLGLRWITPRNRINTEEFFPA